MERLVSGDLDIDIVATQRGAEIGAMARTVQVFRDNAPSLKAMQTAQEASKAQAEAENRRVM